jgi:hypothetical protein
MRHPLQWYVEYYESSVNRHFQSDHFRSSLLHTFTGMCWAGWVDPVVRSREVLVGLRQAVRSVEYARRVSPTARGSVRSTMVTYRGRWPGLQSTFPGAWEGAARNWPLGSLALAISNIAWPSVVGCGLPNLGLFHHATLPSLLTGLDKVDALQHLSPVLTIIMVSSRTAQRRTSNSQAATARSLASQMTKSKWARRR